MRWLITGADGQLGRSIADELSEKYQEKCILNRAQLDITNSEKIDYIFSQFHPDIVVNTAAWTNVESAEDSPELAYLVNSAGAGFIAESCKKFDSRLIQISTDYVFSGDSRIPWHEDSLRSPLSVYGKSKLMGEDEVVRIYPESTLILRTAWLYSRYGNNFVKKIVSKALDKHSKINVVADQMGQPTCAKDLALRIIQLGESNVINGTFHATSGGETSWYLLAVKIFELLGEDVSRVNAVPTAMLNQKAVRPKYSALGHEYWNNVGIEPLRNWEIALESSIAEILESVKREL
jgi:dTDP-4-dehydrorhamnose reductase